MTTIVFCAFHSNAQGKAFIASLSTDANYVIINFNRAYYRLLRKFTDIEDIKAEIMRTIEDVNYHVVDNSFMDKIQDGDDRWRALEHFSKLIIAYSDLFIEDDLSKSVDIIIAGDVNLFFRKDDINSMKYLTSLIHFCRQREHHSLSINPIDQNALLASPMPTLDENGKPVINIGILPTSTRTTKAIYGFKLLYAPFMANVVEGIKDSAGGIQPTDIYLKKRKLLPPIIQSSAAAAASVAPAPYTAPRPSIPQVSKRASSSQEKMTSWLPSARNIPLLPVVMSRINLPTSSQVN